MIDVEQIITNSDLETQQLGKKFAEQLSSGDVIFLHGDLGAGKTTFVKGIAQGLKIENLVVSPTFTILRTYETKHDLIKKLYHIDLYRLDENTSEKSMGIDEILNDNSSVIVIEWPEKIKLSKKGNWEIIFENIGELARKIIIKKI